MRSRRTDTRNTTTHHDNAPRQPDNATEQGGADGDTHTHTDTDTDTDTNPAKGATCPQ
jgi:hypothetical protein